MKHHIKHNPSAEHIRGIGVRLPDTDLWSHVPGGTAAELRHVAHVLLHMLPHAPKAGPEDPLHEVHPRLLLCVAAVRADHAEVDELEVTVAGEEDVVELDVAVDDPPVVQILKREDLLYDQLLCQGGRRDAHTKEPKYFFASWESRRPLGLLAIFWARSPPVQRSYAAESISYHKEGRGAEGRTERR